MLSGIKLLFLFGKTEIDSKEQGNEQLFTCWGIQ